MKEYERPIQIATETLLKYLIPIPIKGFWYHPREMIYRGTKGMPDIMGHYTKKDKIILFAIELKKNEKTKPTFEQQAMLHTLATSGYKTAVCYTVEQVNNFIMEMIK